MQQNTIMLDLIKCCTYNHFTYKRTNSTKSFYHEERIKDSEKLSRKQNTIQIMQFAANLTNKCRFSLALIHL